MSFHEDSEQPASDLQKKVSQITWILSDVDGVMTDGGICYDSQGTESKKFHVRDGLGVKLWRLAGGRFGILTARKSEAVHRRATELKVDYISQGSENKWAQAKAHFQVNNIDLNSVCYIGDDLTDLPVLNQVGLSVCVADAAQELVESCDWITDRPGGYGAVREVVERLLLEQGKWQETLASYQRQCSS